MKTRLKSLYLLAGLTGAVLLLLGRPAAATTPAAAPVIKTDDVAALLERQTQELFDAITNGTAAVWDRYLDPQVTYIDESGSVLTKKDLVDGTKPLPAGVSGSIKVTAFKAHVDGDVAVTTHVEDEHETYHGHQLHCQYRTTDTWKKTPAGWRLLAGQVLALRTDPPAMALKPEQADEYVGRYSLAPDITYEIRKKDGGLEGVQNGRPAEVLKVEAPDVLFVPGKVRYRKIIVRDAQGHVTGFAERREAWDLEWKRLP